MRSIELLVTREIQKNGIAVCLNPSASYVLTPTLAHEIRQFQNHLAEQYFSNPWDGVLYIVWYLNECNQPAWRGLDFQFILETLKNHQEQKLEKYLHELFDLLYLNYIALGLPIINCSIVNHKLAGISQEFFLLNQINFFKLKPTQFSTEVIEPINFDQTFSKCAFPRYIYDCSHVYGFNSLNLNAMRNTLKTIQHKPFDETKLNQIKAIFDEVRDETQKVIYKLALTKPNLIKRMADIQVLNSAFCSSNEKFTLSA